MSSSEAEYVTVLEICQEIMSIKSILEFIKVKVKTLITVYCDNVGAIFSAYKEDSALCEQQHARPGFHPGLRFAQQRDPSAE